MTTVVIGPATQDIALARGTTPRLRVRLTSRNVRSGALTPRPVAGDKIEWVLAWAQAETKTTDPGGGLTLDRVSRVVEYPITLADLGRIPAEGVKYRISVINADGRRHRWLEGTIRATGQE